MTACTVTSVVGFPKLNEWAGVAQNQSGSLVLAFAIQGEGASNLGKDLLDQLHEFEPHSAQDLHQGLLDLLSQVRHTHCSIQFAASLIGPEKVVFGSFGGSVTLKKPTKVQELIGGDDQLQLIEGKRGAYTIVLATAAAADYLTEIQERLAQGYRVDTISSALIRGIQNQPETSQLAVAFAVCTGPETAGQILEQHTAATATLLAHASAESPGVKPEVLPTPTISVESIDNEPTKEAAGSAVSRFNAATLPTRPNQLRRMKRTLASLTTSLLALTTSFAQQQIPKLTRSAGLLVSASQRFATKLPTLPARYHQADQITKRKIWIVVGGTALLVLGALGVAVWRQQEQARLTQQYTTAITAPLALKTEASQLINSDPIKAREKANQAIEELEQLVPQFRTNRQLTDTLAAEISAAKNFATEISGKQELSEPQIFFDLRLTDSSFVATTMTATGKTLFFLDKEKRQVVMLDTETKQSSLLSFTTTAIPVGWTATSNQLYLLGDGLQSYDLEKKSLESLKTSGDSDRDGTALKMFGNYLYVLNPIKRNIFRFTLGKAGLSEGIGWITDKKDLDFSQVHDMAVDGSIWLTTKTGEVKKYTQGRPQTFTIEGLETQFNSPLIISTSETQSNLFILEPNQNRLVILTKEGKLVKEVKSAALGAATGLAATDDQTAVYVLSGSVVYVIPISTT